MFSVTHSIGQICSWAPGIFGRILPCSGSACRSWGVSVLEREMFLMLMVSLEDGTVESHLSLAPITREEYISAAFPPTLRKSYCAVSLYLHVPCLRILNRQKCVARIIHLLSKPSLPIKHGSEKQAPATCGISPRRTMTSILQTDLVKRKTCPAFACSLRPA